MCLLKRINLSPEQELEEDWPTILLIKRISQLKNSRKTKVHLMNHSRSLKHNQNKLKVKTSLLLKLRIAQLHQQTPPMDLLNSLLKNQLKRQKKNLRKWFSKGQFQLINTSLEPRTIKSMQMQAKLTQQLWISQMLLQITINSISFKSSKTNQEGHLDGNSLLVGDELVYQVNKL